MNSSHQHFFRFFLLNRICTKEVATEVIAKLSELPDNTDANLQTFFDTINENIKKYDLELVEGKSEVTGKNMMALVQICSIPLPEGKASDKKASLLFSKLLTQIVLSKSKCISETTAVNLSNIAELGKTVVQGLVNTFIRQMWFEVQNGMLYLGPRSVLELGSLLSSSYPDHVIACSLCRNNIFYGNTCLHCQNKFHIYCLQRFLENSKTCPSCKKPWDEDIMNDETLPYDGPSRSKRPRLISE